MSLLQLLLTSVVSVAAPIRVAVIDTGIQNTPYTQHIKFCDGGHMDFSGTGLVDRHGHGTNVASLIADYAGPDADYCIVVIKYYDPSPRAFNSTRALLYSLWYARYLNVDIINLSSSGTFQQSTERNLVESILQKKIVFFNAAGNDAIDLNHNCLAFPACYLPKTIVVSNLDPYSNKGKIVDIYDIRGGYYNSGGYKMRGTSQSTAMACGKFIRHYSAIRKPADINEREAMEKASEAFIKQNRLDKMAEQYYNNNVPPRFKLVLDYLIPSIQAFTEKKILIVIPWE